MTKAVERDSIYRRRRFQPEIIELCARAPLLELSPSELESYGVDSLSDLVDALKYLTCESAAAARESRQIAWNFAQELILRKRKCLLDEYSQGARLVRRA
jgi:hypothetical protein